MDTEATFVTPELRALILRRRRELGWSQEALSTAVGNVSLVKRLEDGKVDEHELVPAIVELLVAGKLPARAKPAGRCRRCQILVYDTPDEVPAGAPGAAPFQVLTDAGTCQACEAELAEIEELGAQGFAKEAS